MWLLTESFSQTAIRKLPILHCHTYRLLRIEVNVIDGFKDPVDICRDTRDDALSTIVKAKTVDANSSPRVLLIFACQRTSTITLPTHVYICVLQLNK